MWISDGRQLDCRWTGLLESGLLGCSNEDRVFLIIFGGLSMMCQPGRSPYGQLGVQPCCGADASSSRGRVTSSRIIAGSTGEVPLRDPSTKQVREILSPDSI